MKFDKVFVISKNDYFLSNEFDILVILHIKRQVIKMSFISIKKNVNVFSQNIFTKSVSCFMPQTLHQVGIPNILFQFLQIFCNISNLVKTVNYRGNKSIA